MKLDQKEIEGLKALLNSIGVTEINKKHRKVLIELKEKLARDSKMTLYTDGAADLHTGTAGIGGIIYRNNEELISYSEFIGKGTNNEAEYKALIKGLDLLIELGCTTAEVYLDSELVVRQVNGLYKVKNGRMQTLHKKVSDRIARLPGVTVTHITRDKNKVADKLSKDGRLSGT